MEWTRTCSEGVEKKTGLTLPSADVERVTSNQNSDEDWLVDDDLTRDTSRKKRKKRGKEKKKKFNMIVLDEVRTTDSIEIWNRTNNFHHCICLSIKCIHEMKYACGWCLIFDSYRRNRKRIVAHSKKFQSYLSSMLFFFLLWLALNEFIHILNIRVFLSLSSCLDKDEQSHFLLFISFFPFFSKSNDDSNK